ncbi:hypothetical protein AURDEDRAFT_175077 [Auricularia subglabra TFB-10046 SS5]|nr:hypothetical protein AURDEDRAFT_175077 [Auricularia subglabra TFB-10046 SS5]
MVSSGTYHGTDRALPVNGVWDAHSYGLSENKIEEVVCRILKNNVSRPASNNPFNNQRSFRYAKPPPADGAAVHLVDVDDFGMPDSDPTPTLDDYALAAANLSASGCSRAPATTPDRMVHSVYAFLAKQSKQRPPPKGGYMFPKSSHASPKPPPSPCKVCGGEKHWDRKCPHWSTYERRCRQGVLTVNLERPPDEDDMYESVYTPYVKDMISHLSCAAPDVPVLNREGTSSSMYDPLHHARKASVEEAEDEFHDWYQRHAKLAVDSRHILEDETEFRANLSAAVPPLVPRVATHRTSLEEVKDEELHSMREKPKASPGALLEEVTNEAGVKDWQFDLEPVVFTHSLTASLRGEAGPPLSDEVLHVPALVAIPPRIKKGMKVRIAQLNNSDPSIEGYITTPIFIQASDDM